MALTPAEKMHARRQRLAAAGICTRCGNRKAAHGITLCRPCNEGAKERVRSSREG